MYKVKGYLDLSDMLENEDLDLVQYTLKKLFYIGLVIFSVLFLRLKSCFPFSRTLLSKADKDCLQWCSMCN